jgi:hypothetical protein
MDQAGMIPPLGDDRLLCVEHEYAAASPKHALKRLMAWRICL